MKAQKEQRGEEAGPGGLKQVPIPDGPGNKGYGRIAEQIRAAAKAGMAVEIPVPERFTPIAFRNSLTAVMKIRGLDISSSVFGAQESGVILAWVRQKERVGKGSKK